jgi:hypothetical protein
MDKKEFMGLMISFSGMISLPFLFSYSYYTHARKLKSTGKSREIVKNLVMIWLLLCYIPLTIVF